MILFFIGIVILLLGYLVYSRYVDKVFSPDETRKTPASKNYDGVDFVPLSSSKNSLIQLLNIAGTGPIFGPILGALFGPIAFIMIPIGNVIAGAVHDYMIGMIATRNKGAHIPLLAGHFLGLPMKHVVNIFSVLLLLLLGTVFVRSPSDLFVQNFGGDVQYYGIVIFLYYVFATVLPIDKFIGKLYPILGAMLIVSSFGIGIGIFIYFRDYIPAANFTNMHPKNLPIVPIFFMTVTCGLLSGFHATQSPIISRTLKNEKEGRSIFYGMMTVEGLIAMIWALAAMVVFNKEGVFSISHYGGPAGVVTLISQDIFGVVLGSIMVLGVIVLPITSGDTSFRSLRMIVAEYIGMSQVKIRNRFYIAIPLFLMSFGLFFVDFSVLWRYFSWANQTTGVIALFIATSYLYLKKKNYFITLIPGIFMLFVTLSYLGNAKIGFNLSWNHAYVFAIILSVVLIIAFFVRNTRLRDKGIKTDDIFDIK